MSAEYAIICDRCSATIGISAVSSAAARVDAREGGGRVNLRRGKAKDLCADCKAIREEQQR